MKDGIVGEKTLEALENHLRLTFERDLRTLESERRMAFRDYIITGNAGWYMQVGKKLDMLIDDIANKGGRIVCDGWVSVIDWGDEA